MASATDELFVKLLQVTLHLTLAEDTGFIKLYYDNFWASENLSGRVHFEGYSPEWRVLSN